MDLARATEYLVERHRRGVTSSTIYFVDDLALSKLLAKGIVKTRIVEETCLDTEAAEVGAGPVRGPVVDVAGHVVTTVGASAGRIEADRRGAADAAIKVGPVVARPVVAPGIAAAIAAARRLLPLGVGRQAPTRPASVGIGPVPA